MNKHWKLKYFEKSNDESHINIHRSLEIEHYYKQLLKKNGFNLFNFKLNFTNYVLTVFFCIYTKESQQGKKDLKLKKINKFGFLKNSLKSLSIYMGNKFKIILKIRNASSSPKSNNLSKTLFNLNFDRFKIPEMKKLYLILATQTNSTELLGSFIAKQLKITKRHNFFFSFKIFGSSLLFARIVSSNKVFLDFNFNVKGILVKKIPVVTVLYGSRSFITTNSLGGVDAFRVSFFFLNTDRHLSHISSLH